MIYERNHSQARMGFNSYVGHFLCSSLLNRKEEEQHNNKILFRTYFRTEKCNHNIQRSYYRKLYRQTKYIPVRYPNDLLRLIFSIILSILHASFLFKAIAIVKVLVPVNNLSSSTCWVPGRWTVSTIINEIDLYPRNPLHHHLKWTHLWHWTT